MARLNTNVCTVSGWLADDVQNAGKSSAYFKLRTCIWQDGGMKEYELPVFCVANEKTQAWLKKDKDVVVTGSLRLTSKGNVAIYSSGLELQGSHYYPPQKAEAPAPAASDEEIPF